MPVNVQAIVIAALAAAALPAQEADKSAAPKLKTETVTNPALREELVKRMKAEQNVRREMQKAAGGKMVAPIGGPAKEVMERMRKIDAENLAWLKEVVEKHGWPTKSMVGKDGATGAFLIAQHAVSDLEFMDKVLQHLKKAHAIGEAEGQWVALMTDRLLVMRDGKPQLYGTQLMFQDGKMVPQPIDDEANVDKRRKEMGLPPLADYLKMVNGKGLQIVPKAPAEKTAAEEKKPEPTKKD